MTSDETRLEDDAPEEEERTRLEGSDPEITRLEGGDSDATVLEKGRTGRSEGLGLLGRTFDGGGATYRVLEALPATGSEADIYIVHEEDSEDKRVLKYYRRGIRPKTEITEMLADLDERHVVRVYETGDRHGRSYEIQEFVEHGSLSDLLSPFPDGLPDGRMKEILQELLIAVEHLHERDVIHRDIKPTNVLIRSSDPLDLVFADFGIASRAESSLHKTSASRTVSYASPEALTGVVAKASDWWSVGVMLLELLTGRHPFAGLNEQVVNYQLVSKGIAVPNEIEENWKLLLKGLLTKDIQKRWGEGQVLRWLKGDRSIAVAYDAEEDAKKYGYRPYEFAGKQYYEPADLAVGLAEDWQAGLKDLGRGFLTDWIKNEFHHIELTNQLMDVEEDETLDASKKLSAALMILNPELPLLDEQGVFDRDSASSRASALQEILSGGLGGWLKELRADGWVLELKREYYEFRSEIHQYLKDLDETLVNTLFLLPEEAFAEKWEDFIEQYGACSVSSLNKLFPTNGENPTRPEKIVLLSLSREFLKTHEQFRQEVYDNAPVLFNCPKLRDVLRRKMVFSAADIIRKDFFSLNTLRAEAEGIRDLSGLEYATELTWLYLPNNQITDLSPLANLTNLTELYLPRNKITDLSHLANLPNLTRLNLSHNQITDLSPLANLRNLKELILKSESIGFLTNLSSFATPQNQIVDVSPLANLGNLRKLRLEGQRIGFFKRRKFQKALPGCTIFF